MSISYRNIARSALARAKSELETNDGRRLHYAALDLRMALEALTYERVTLYKDDIPPTEYGTWQPPNLMKMLVAIDSTVGQDSTLIVREEGTTDQSEDNVVFVGKENALSMKVINKHYHALGSYLHIPTIDKLQIEVDHINKKLRARCEEVSSYLHNVLSSSVWNVNVKDTTTMACVRCNKTMIRRRNTANEEQIVRCWECDARYKLVDKPNNKVEWVPEQVSFVCPNEACGTPYYFWLDQVKIGADWTCDDCGRKWVFAFGVTADNSQPLFVPEE